MSKMNQKFVEEYGSGFTKDMEDFNDDDYQYKKWLLEIQPNPDKPITMEDLDKWKTISDEVWDRHSGMPNPKFYKKTKDIPYNELGM